MKFLYEYWFCIYLRTRANTRADIVPVTLSALFRPQKTYFLLSEGSKSLIIMFFLFPELNSINNITMLKKLPDHFNNTRISLGFQLPGVYRNCKISNSEELLLILMLIPVSIYWRGRVDSPPSGPAP